MLNSFQCWPMTGESRERGQQLGFAKAGLLHILLGVGGLGLFFNKYLEESRPGLKVRFNMFLVSLVFLQPRLAASISAWPSAVLAPLQQLWWPSAVCATREAPSLTGLFSARKRGFCSCAGCSSAVLPGEVSTHSRLVARSGCPFWRCSLK